MTLRILTLFVVSVFTISTANAQKSRLTEGDKGLAAKYVGDRGIEKDKSVVFVEKFDGGSIEKIGKRWESVVGKAGMSLSQDIAPGSADDRSLLFTHVGGKGTGSQLYRRLKPRGHDLIFARFYVKFDRDCAAIHHFGTHIGGFNPSTPWPQGGAGIRPDGSKRFTTGVEPYGRDWEWGFYTYWQGMRRHGGGKYWGTPFLVGVKKPKVERDKWICVEVMVKMNDSGKYNGEQAFWIDGKLWRAGGQIVSHIGPGYPTGRWTGGWWRPDVKRGKPFEGFNWRNTRKLNINYLWTYLYITRAPQGHVSKVWFDNIVVAKSYIGPIRKK